MEIISHLKTKLQLQMYVVLIDIIFNKLKQREIYINHVRTP